MEDRSDGDLKQDLAPWGYAPGSGLFYCTDCISQRLCVDDTLHHGHKHSTRCLPHALDARLRDIRIDEAQIYPEPITAPVAPAEVLQDPFLRTQRQIEIVALICLVIVGLIFWQI